jgi:hypothetical protein
LRGGAAGDDASGTKGDIDNDADDCNADEEDSFSDVGCCEVLCLEDNGVVIDEDTARDDTGDTE